MKHIINAKELRASLPEIVKKVGHGDQYTVFYRSRPAFRIVGVDTEDEIKTPLDEDPLYNAEAVGATTDGLNAVDHDVIIYR